MLINKNGYCQNFQIYTVKSKENYLGARVVKNMLEDMEGKHSVYFDHFFSQKY